MEVSSRRGQHAILTMSAQTQYRQTLGHLQNFYLFSPPTKVGLGSADLGLGGGLGSAVCGFGYSVWGVGFRISTSRGT